MSTLYSAGQMNQVADSFEAAGYTPEEVARFRNLDLNQIRSVLNGQAKIVLIPQDQDVAKKKPIQLIHLAPVTSNGRSGQEWVTNLKKEKFNLNPWTIDTMTKGRDAKGNLGFVATNGVTYKPVVIKGEEFTDDERVTSYIRKVAAELKLITPPAELAPLVREAVSDEDMAKMGLNWLVTMHESIIDSGGGPGLLCSRRGDGGRRLSAYGGRPTDGWFRLGGFVFLAPQD